MFEETGVVFFEVDEPAIMVEVTLDCVLSFNRDGEVLIEARYWCKVLLFVETECGLL